MKPLRVIISGGGTGGHIFPALSIAAKLKETNPQTEILFVGALGRMEMEKAPAKRLNNTKESVWNNVIGAIVGFLIAGIIWAAVQAF